MAKIAICVSVDKKTHEKFKKMFRYKLSSYVDECLKKAVREKTIEIRAIK